MVKRINGRRVYDRPFRLIDHIKWAVVLDAKGKVVAQGEYEMCERVIEEGPIWLNASE